MTAARQLPSLTGRSPRDYARSVLHAPSRAYAESNCYTDVIIELLHARGLEPRAMLGHLVRVDFEGDQWTFFKPPPEDLEALYGVDIHEMQPYRPLPLQSAEQIARGRTLIVELDSFHLPDTAGTSYRTAHVKSSVAVEAIDAEREVMRYFHGPSLWELSGEDYRGVFRLDDQDPKVLPPYTEIVRFDAGPAAADPELRGLARAILVRHLSRRPARNPFIAFGESLQASLGDLLGGDLELYHAYAFATVRMAGSAFELVGDHLAWLFPDGATAAADAAASIVEGCKTLSFRLARRRPFDPAERITALGAAWDRMMSALVGILVD